MANDRQYRKQDQGTPNPVAPEHEGLLRGIFRATERQESNLPSLGYQTSLVLKRNFPFGPLRLVEPNQAPRDTMRDSERDTL
jgi:hypothetical protein